MTLRSHSKGSEWHPAPNVFITLISSQMGWRMALTVVLGGRGIGFTWFHVCGSIET